MRKIYDAIIIGSGAAGYSAADWLFKEGITDIAVITENRLSGTSRNTGSDKQTYYKISMDGISTDSALGMAKDLCVSGSCDGVRAYKQAVNSAKCFLRLCDYGVNFPQDSFGGYPGYKTDHDSTSRATSVGPLTSKIMTERLEDVVINRNRTPVLDGMQVIGIVRSKNSVEGVIVLNKKSGKPEAIAAKNIIVATGAPACIYESSVYPESQHGMTGILIESGVRLCNFSQWQYGLSSTDFRWNVSGSFMQVIPRFVSIDENGNEEEFLRRYFENDSELCSTVFLKGYQWPFSFDRLSGSSAIDVAVHEQILLGKKVFLDFTKNPEGFCFDSLSDEAKEYLSAMNITEETPVERLKKLNPKAIRLYADNGIDLFAEKLRIAVCAQHNNGGIYTDENYMSDVGGLYVIGEAAGSFGLTRPGGSALNDTQVGGLVCAKHIASTERSAPDCKALEAAFAETEKLISEFTLDETVDYSFIRTEMSNCASFIRDYGKCISLLEKLSLLIEGYPKKHRSLSEYYYDRDMLLSAQALLETIVTEMPETGSRGGAVFVQNGTTVPENKEYRNYLTLTENGSVSYVKASPVPCEGRPFEAYLNESNI